MAISGYVQAKATTTGPLTDTLAYRASFSGTQRDGVLWNVTDQDDLNDLNNIGGRAAAAVDAERHAGCEILGGQYGAAAGRLCAGVCRRRADAAPAQPAICSAGGVLQLRAAEPQSVRSRDRRGHAAPFQLGLGGVALNVDWDVGGGTLSAISAWRYWIWDPANDRDFLGLPIRTLSQNPSKSYQWSQELRYAGDFSDNLSFVVGAFWFNQVTKTLGREEQGSAAWRWLTNPNATNTLLGGLGALDGYGQRVQIRSDHTSTALFGQLEWQVTISCASCRACA
jgi:iron complex outermembrane receptor protein